MNYPSARILNVSYSSSLPMRDNRRTIKIIKSPEYQRMYGDLFKLTKDGELLIENNHTGFKQGFGIGGGVTGNRCDFLICDDLNNITAKETIDVMDETNRKFLEGVTNRLNDMVHSCIIVIAQRCHKNDVSGFILTSDRLLSEVADEPTQEFTNALLQGSYTNDCPPTTLLISKVGTY